MSGNGSPCGWHGGCRSSHKGSGHATSRGRNGIAWTGDGLLHGDATDLDFEDETFDAVTSNYVYHNIMGVNKQELLLETLRVLKKGGTFAIHDIMSKGRYGDMQAFVESLKAQGYEEAKLIPTDCGMFMSRAEATWMGLSGSCLLVGKK